MAAMIDNQQLISFVKRVANAETDHCGPTAADDLLDGLQDSARELLKEIESSHD